MKILRSILTKRTLSESFVELDTKAKNAVREAREALLARNIPVYHYVDGCMIETSPDGTTKKVS